MHKSNNNTGRPFATFREEAIRLQSAGALALVLKAEEIASAPRRFSNAVVARRFNEAEEEIAPLLDRQEEIPALLRRAERMLHAARAADKATADREASAFLSAAVGRRVRFA